MSRLLLASSMTLVLLAACRGTEEDATPEPERFALVVPNGGELAAPPDKITYVVLTAVGPNAASVTFSASPLPAFATLSGDTLTLQPARSDDGSYDIAVTASSGAESDTRTLHVVVDAPNRLPGFYAGDAIIRDAFGDSRFLDGYLSTHRQISDPCTWPLMLGFTARDPDGDRVKVQVEVASTEADLRGVPTAETALWDPNIGGQWPSLQLTSAPSDEFVIAGRAVDERGGTSEWVVIERKAKRCFDVGAGIPSFFTAGTTVDVPVTLAGVGAAPFTLSLVNPPSFMSLNGTTLTVTSPPNSPTRESVRLRLETGGRVYERDAHFWVSQPTQ